MILLAALQLLVAVFLLLVGNFADGGEWWERVILTVLHPVGAVALVILAVRHSLSPGILMLLSVLLALNVLADLFLAVAIATGVTDGDLELPMIFAIIPAVGVLYAVYLLRRSS